MRKKPGLIILVSYTMDRAKHAHESYQVYFKDTSYVWGKKPEKSAASGHSGL